MPVAEDRTKLWYLHSIEAFKFLTQEEMKAVDAMSKMRDVKKGEVIYLQGTADDRVFILKQGTVKITKLTEDGKEIIIDIIKASSIFGEMPSDEQGTRDESTVVIEDGTVCTIPRKEFERMLQMMPKLATQITKLIGFRRRRIENKLLSLVYSSVEQRLARTLLGLRDEFGAPSNGGFVLRIRLTHNDYAELIASTRETVTAVLNRFRKEGLIDFEGRKMEIKSPEKLQSLAG
jgi:CRP-like cAMP-binding protein